jgi:hypothetical protein
LGQPRRPERRRDGAGRALSAAVVPGRPRRRGGRRKGPQAVEFRASLGSGGRGARGPRGGPLGAGGLPRQGDPLGPLHAKPPETPRLPLVRDLLSTDRVGPAAGEDDALSEAARVRWRLDPNYRPKTLERVRALLDRPAPAGPIVG